MTIKPDIALQQTLISLRDATEGGILATRLRPGDKVAIVGPKPRPDRMTRVANVQNLRSEGTAMVCLRLDGELTAIIPASTMVDADKRTPKIPVHRVIDRMTPAPSFVHHRTEPGAYGHGTWFDEPRRIDSISLLNGLVTLTLTRQPRANISQRDAGMLGAADAWSPGSVTASIAVSRPKTESKSQTNELRRGIRFLLGLE